MKVYIEKLTIAGLAFTLLISGLVIAEELPNPGILPDHPFYPVKRFLENVRLWLTFDPEARARFHAFLAEQRLAELNATISQGKYQYAIRLREEYEKEMNESENEMERSFGLGRNTTALLEHVCNVTYKHVAVLERVLSRAPEAARPGLERAINASIQGHLRCLERVEELMNKTNESAGRRSCTSDADCANLPVWCPLGLQHNLTCFIPPNKTTGICVCEPIWKKVKVNCSDDWECLGLVCPMIVGNDTPICLNGKCVCGAKWQIRNRSEWERRFGEEFGNVTQGIQERIRERVEARIRKG